MLSQQKYLKKVDLHSPKSSQSYSLLSGMQKESLKISRTPPLYISIKTRAIALAVITIEASHSSR